LHPTLKVVSKEVRRYSVDHIHLKTGKLKINTAWAAADREKIRKDRQDTPKTLEKGK
jgi:hypothetical protein